MDVFCSRLDSKTLMSDNGNILQHWIILTGRYWLTRFSILRDQTSLMNEIMSVKLVE